MSIGSKRMSRLQVVIAAMLVAAPVSGNDDSRFTVVLDPGHGGADLGTVFENGRIRIAEKDVTLALAEEAARQIRSRGIRAVITRAKDIDLPLATRTEVANKLRAHLFISIHMNSTGTAVADAEGIETYILNHTSDMTSRRIAHLENSVLGGTVAVREAGGSKDVELILKDLTLEATLPESKRLGCSLQRHMTRGLPRAVDRGVRQALFHVLLGADMPSALIEAGFLSHARDRARVLSVAGRRTLGRSIAEAVEEFRNTRRTPIAQAQLSNCKVR